MPDEALAASGLAPQHCNADLNCRLRPAYLRPGEFMEHAVAKATYIKSRRIWKIYWMRADLEWHRYDPLPAVSTIDDFIVEVYRDPYGCFFG